jgi:hypothetical protein
LNRATNRRVPLGPSRAPLIARPVARIIVTDPRRNAYVTKVTKIPEDRFGEREGRVEDGHTRRRRLGSDAKPHKVATGPRSCSVAPCNQGGACEPAAGRPCPFVWGRGRCVIGCPIDIHPEATLGVVRPAPPRRRSRCGDSQFRSKMGVDGLWRSCCTEEEGPSGGSPAAHGGDRFDDVP